MVFFGLSYHLNNFDGNDKISINKTKTKIPNNDLKHFDWQAVTCAIHSLLWRDSVGRERGGGGEEEGRGGEEEKMRGGEGGKGGEGRGGEEEGRGR